MFYQKIKQNIVHSILKNNDIQSEEDREEIQYAIDLVFDSSIKILLLIFIMAFLHILKFFILSALVMWALRSKIGGIHFKSSVACFLFTLVFYLTTIYSSLYLPYNLYFSLIYYVLSFILIYRYAPADTELKPLISKSLRLKLRKQGFLIFFLFLFASLIIYFVNSTISAVISITVFCSAITIHPLIYKIFRQPYNNYLKYLEKKGG